MLLEVGKQLGNAGSKASVDFQKENREVFSLLRWLFSALP